MRHALTTIADTIANSLSYCCSGRHAVVLAGGWWRAFELARHLMKWLTGLTPSGLHVGLRVHLQPAVVTGAVACVSRSNDLGTLRRWCRVEPRWWADRIAS